MKRIYILLILLIFTLTLYSCTDTPDNDDTDITDDDQTIEEDPTLKELPYYAYLSNDNPVVTISVKDYGDMKLQLFIDVAPNTVNNFINYIEDKAYKNSEFHRIIEDFMIQGGIVSNNSCPIKGDFSSNGISNNLSHNRGVISMARTNVKDSATSQFFIVHNNSDFLDGNYASFGGLISGFEILDELAVVSTDVRDAPIRDIVISKITVDLRGYKISKALCA